mmetsp:Transcript_14847/g.20241  ORF Transcript_14847/g.20241 Transcript_14847/m.20241 type:complete len:272 (-) Transcript_14847:148-963(-)
MFSSNALLLSRVRQTSFLDTEQDDYGFFFDDDEVESDNDSVSTDLDAQLTHLPNEPMEASRSFPPILSPFMMEQIADRGLPSCLQDHAWDRLYSSSRDGDCFRTFMRKVRGFSCTLVVAMTGRGEIVGCFTTSPWSGRKKEQSNSSSDSFLFTVGSTAKGQSCFIPGFEPFGKSPTSAIVGADHQPGLASICGEDNVSLFKCQEAEQYSQLCHIGDKRLAIGGKDGSCALCVYDGFTRGSAGPCNVYGTSTPMLSNDQFDVVEFEVYGFSI